jgi:very-short-patch-repair endonuclease
MYINKTSKVTLICTDHGEFRILPFNHLSYGQVCKKCESTTFNKDIKKFLNFNNISFYQEHKFTDCKNIYQLPFDFYIPPIRTCIEFDGIQHFKPIGHFGGQEALDKLKINDKIKSDYCEDNYIDLIRIRYDNIDNINQILWEALKNKIKMKS